MGRDPETELLGFQCGNGRRQRWREARSFVHQFTSRCMAEQIQKKEKKGEACNPHSFRIVFLLTAPTDRLVVRYGISSKTIPGRRLLRDPVVQRASRVRSRGPLSQAEKDSSHPPTSCTVAERLDADTKDATHTKKKWRRKQIKSRRQSKTADSVFCCGSGG